MMTSDEKAMDCFKYCMVKARTNNTKDALNKIAKALANCEPSKQSIRECIALLKVLEDEE